MGHPWKKRKETNPDPLFEACFAALLERSIRNNWAEIKKQREKIAQMNQNHRRLEQKNRSLKRLIAKHKQGE